jgi:hypothetical protein
MNIRTASELIAQHLAEGRIDYATAALAQRAIRAGTYYGCRMSAADRASILRNRFGIEG